MKEEINEFWNCLFKSTVWVVAIGFTGYMLLIPVGVIHSILE